MLPKIDMPLINQMLDKTSTKHFIKNFLDEMKKTINGYTESLRVQRIGLFLKDKVAEYEKLLKDAERLEPKKGAWVVTAWMVAVHGQRTHRWKSSS